MAEVPVALSVQTRGAASSWSRIARALFRHSTWRVGLVEMPIAELVKRPHLSAGDVHWLALDDAPVIADPFPLHVDGVLYLLYERLTYGATSRKEIHWAALDEKWQVTASGVAKGLPAHSSYPFLFKADGRIFCIPEAHREGRITLYEALEFPARWRAVNVMVPGVPGLDPTLVHHGDYWWLFFTDFRQRGDSDLHLWFAEKLDGPWKAHRANTVKRDPASARPAGTPFAVGDTLYRPAQDCRKEYGSRVVINRVDVLTPEQFAETPVQTVEAAGGGALRDGLHTLSGSGPITLVDGRRRRFVFGAVSMRVARTWNRAVAMGNVEKEPAGR